MPYKDKAKQSAYDAYYYSTYKTTPEARVKRAAYHATTEAKAKKAAYDSTPEAKVKAATRRSTPEVKANRAAYAVVYNSRPEVKVKTKARTRNIRRLKNGWTPEMFEQTLLEQGNVCAVCREPFTDKDAACADHKHVNPPEPRGVLHHSCNVAIGLLKENPARIRAAAAYVETWSLCA